MPDIKYHKKEKILSLRFSKSKSVDSDIQDNIVIDYDKNGDIVNIDVMNINLSYFVPLKQYSSLQIEKVS